MSNENKTVRELHTEAMQYAMDAFVERETEGLTDKHQFLVRKALLLEKEAAGRLEPVAFNEPTRGILYVSVVSLALLAQFEYTAFKQAEKGLQGEPREKEAKFLRAVVSGRLHAGNIKEWEDIVQ